MAMAIVGLEIGGDWFPGKPGNDRRLCQWRASHVQQFSSQFHRTQSAGSGLPAETSAQAGNPAYNRGPSPVL